VRRRDFISSALLSGAALTLPPVALAQQAVRAPRIGILLYSKDDKATINPFLHGLESLGYVDGKNLAIEYRDAAGNYDKVPEVANELVRLNPDVIFSFGGDLAPTIKKATTTIPIVVVVSNDPVESGLVESLGRPGGNITGLTFVDDQLAGKSVEILKDIAPKVSRVAMLWNPNHTDPEFRETQRASRILGIQLQSLEVRVSGDFDVAFQAAERERAEALIVADGRFMFLHREEIGDFALLDGLIVAGTPSFLMQIGALFTYGPNVPELLKNASVYVDKILRGAKPADLPMQQPTTFELNTNLKTAKTLGLTIPGSVLARADKVID
jgi:putative tryptophan/tyrosine transport system substrate-binding protein